MNSFSSTIIITSRANHFFTLIYQLKYVHLYQTCLNCTSFMFSWMIQCVKGYCKPRINVLQQWLLSKFDFFYQGCGNTMPDMADLVPFHSGQVKNCYVGHPISSDNGFISQKLLLKSKFFYPLHVAMGVAYSCLKYGIFITT